MNAEARAHYKHAKINQGPIEEFGFAFTDKFSQIPRNIVSRGRETFYAQPKAAVIPMVREFYANAAERRDSKAFV